MKMCSGYTRFLTHFTLFIFIFSSNKSRTLNCWQEVVDFKQAVSEEQKKFIGAHQN